MERTEKKEKKPIRLFVAEYEYADEWTRGDRSILKVKEDDFYLIFQSGKKIPPSLDCQKIICEMGTHKKMYVCEILPDKDYYTYVKQEILNYSDENTNIYFLGMENAYILLKDEFDYAANVKQCKDYKSIGRIKKKTKDKTAMSKANKNSSDNSDIFCAMGTFVNPSINTPEYPDTMDMIQKENKTGQNNENKKKNIKPHTNDKKEGKKAEKHAIDNLTESLSSSNTIHQDNIPEGQNKKDSLKSSGNDMKKTGNKENIETGNKKTKEKQTENVEEDIIDAHKGDNNVPPKLKPNPHPGQPDSRPDIKRSSSQQRPHVQGSADAQPDNAQGGVQGVQGTMRNNRQQNMRGNFGGKNRAAASPQTPDLSLQQIEDLIFGTQQTQQDFSHVYTEIDDNKARMSDSLIDRFSEELCTLSKTVRGYDFNRADYVLVLTTLVKSEGYEDFVSSWDVAKSGYQLGIDERVYAQLYKHAVYCSKVFDMLYKEDKFK